MVVNQASGKLTEEQRQEKGYGGRFIGRSEEQIREVQERLRNGESLNEVTETTGIPRRTVQRYAQQGDIVCRRRQSHPGKISPKHQEIYDVSALAWSQMHWTERTTLLDLARRFGCSMSTIRCAMRRKGVAWRDTAEAKKVSIAVGRYKRPSVAPSPQFFEAGRRYGQSEANRSRCAELARSPEARRKRARTQQSLNPRQTRPCCWCGTPITRKASRFHQRWGCSKSHARLIVAFDRKQPPGTARPVIVQRLRDLLRAEPYKALPFTVETVEKAGATIGAQEAEVFEVFYEGRQ